MHRRSLHAFRPSRMPSLARLSLLMGKGGVWSSLVGVARVGWKGGPIYRRFGKGDRTGLSQRPSRTRTKTRRALRVHHERATHQSRRREISAHTNTRASTCTRVWCGVDRIDAMRCFRDVMRQMPSTDGSVVVIFEQHSSNTENFAFYRRATASSAMFGATTFAFVSIVRAMKQLTYVM